MGRLFRQEIATRGNIHAFTLHLVPSVIESYAPLAQQMLFSLRCNLSLSALMSAFYCLLVRLVVSFLSSEHLASVQFLSRFRCYGGQAKCVQPLDFFTRCVNNPEGEERDCRRRFV